MQIVDVAKLKRVLPHPPWRIPVLGDLWDLHVTDSSQWGMRGAQLYGTIYERKILNGRVTYVSGPDLVRDVNDESKWAKFLGVPLRNLRSVAGDGLITAHNSEKNWAKAHAILGPAFTQFSMRGYHNQMVDAVNELTRDWSGRSDARWIDIPADMNKLTLKIIGRTAFGYDFGSFANTESLPFVGQMLRSLSYVNRSAYSHPIIEKMFFRRQTQQHQNDVQAVHKLVDDLIEQRISGVDSGSSNDLLDLMLNTADPETGEKLDELNIRNQILTFLVAGHETSAGTLAFALHFLAGNPDIAARARMELDSVWPDSSGELPFDSVARLRYLRRVVDETLRLWPVAPGYFRKARQDTTIGEDHPFKKGEWVFVVLLQLHRNPAWGTNPEEFDPDRFLPENVRKRDPNNYKPFGTGMRACIGRQFAYHEILVALAKILRTFDLIPDPDYTLRVGEMITLKPEGLKLRARNIEA